MGYDAYAVSWLGVEVDLEKLEEAGWDRDNYDETFHDFLVKIPDHERGDDCYLFWGPTASSVGSGDAAEGVELASGEYVKVYLGMKEKLEPLGLWSH